VDDVIKRNFNFHNIGELNDFIKYILDIGEYYIKFLISKGRIYLSPDIDAKDAAVDLLAELFTAENNNLIKFSNFFDDISNRSNLTNDELDRYLRSFVYTIIQNNLPELYRTYDPATYHILRNVKLAVKNLNYFTVSHFSGKYIHKVQTIPPDSVLPDRDELKNIIILNNLEKDVINLKIFIEKLFLVLDNSSKYAPAVYLHDVCSVIKGVFASEFITRDGAATEAEHISEKTNIRFILDDVKFTFSGKLEKYILKNNLSQNFGECIYMIVDEIIDDLNEGNTRQSVLELMKTHFKSSEKSLFYKVQYCIELFESEIIKHIQTEKILIGK